MMVSVSRRSTFLLPVVLGLTLLVLPASAFDDWLPISDEEKALTDLKESPGAPAVLLYRNVEADDINSYEDNYYRVKILTEEGKEFGNIEIPYIKGRGGISVRGLKARTVQPDGTIVPFKGEVFDRLIVKTSGIKVQAKVFSFPEVQVGSILEYRYRLGWDADQLRASFWEIQSDLFTRQAHFSFRPWVRGIEHAWSTQFLPADSQPQEAKGGRIVLDIENVPAFEEERFMPPESALRSRVTFFYFGNSPKNADDFWESVGKNWNTVAERFIGNRGGIRKAALDLVSPDDSEEVKVAKIYAQVQQIRNLTYERSRSEEERKREQIKDNQNVEDVLKHGYGYRIEINRLFVALVRAAGLEADVVRISERDAWFFNKNRLSGRQLDGELAVVKVNGEDRWYDPSTPYCPIGMLSWHRTGVLGIRLDKRGGEFILTPQPRFDDALIERSATLHLDESGTLEGTLTATFHGMEAISRRKDMMEADEDSAEDDIKEELEGWMPSNATIEIVEITGWTTSEEPLRVTAKVKLADYAMSTGSRLLVPTGVFVSNDANPFRHEKRVHPVYFRSPYQRTDDLTIEMPDGMEIESLPSAQQHVPDFGRYRAQASFEEGKIHVRRNLVLAGYMFPLAHYPALRKFFSDVSISDEEQVVLRMAKEGTDD